MASYPGAVKSFVSRNAGDVIQPAHVNDLQDEVNAIEAGLLNGTAPLNSSNSTMVTLTLSGGQLTFPAVQSASTNANTLDDYEEGSWTPVLGGTGGTSGQTYTTQIGRYVKIGRLVVAFFDITLSAKGTITTDCQISGLPFAAETAGNVVATAAANYAALGTNWVNVVLVIITGSSVAVIQGSGAASGGNNTALTTADITNTTTMRGTLVYRASA